MIAFRRKHPVIIDGSFKEYFEDHDRLFAYMRENDDERLFTMLNFSATQFTLILPEDIDVSSMNLEVSNIGRKDLGGNIITVYPYESFVLVGKK